MQSILKKSGRFQSKSPLQGLYEPAKKGSADPVWFDGMSHTGSFSAENGQLFSQLLIDQKQNYWFAEKKDKKKEKTNIYIFNDRGLFLKNVVVTGYPNLYQFDGRVYAACEGSDNMSRVYEYCTENYRLTQHWTIDGFLWDVAKVDDRLYVSSYLPDSDEAVLYILQNREVEELLLGKQFFPTKLLSVGEFLYISAFPVLDSDEKKMIVLDSNHECINEFSLNVSPYSMYLHKNELVIHGVELFSGKKERLLYYNIHSGEQKEYPIPQAFTVRESNNQLLLYNSETESVVEWDHHERNMMKAGQVTHYENQKALNFQSYNQ